MALRPPSILLVDDHHDGADSLAELFNLSGYPARVAYTPETALAVAEDAAPDVLVADIGMPRFDGCELAKRIAGTVPRRPLLIAVTGYAHEGMRERCREAGFDHFFVKPVEFTDLLAVIRSHAEQLPADGSAPPTS